MLTNQEIKSTIESAFRPLRCAAEIWDYEQKLRLRVFDLKDRPVLRVDEIVLRTSRSVSQLVALIDDIRARICERGHTLEPWQVVSKEQLAGD